VLVALRDAFARGVRIASICTGAFTQQLLETTSHGVERIGREVGFASPANFREQFRRLAGVSPQTYRNTFRERIAG